MVRGVLEDGSWRGEGGGTATRSHPLDLVSVKLFIHLNYTNNDHEGNLGPRVDIISRDPRSIAVTKIAKRKKKIEIR